MNIFTIIGIITVSSIIGSSVSIFCLWIMTRNKQTKN